jgi:hypothetical protein
MGRVRKTEESEWKEGAGYASRAGLSAVLVLNFVKPGHVGLAALRFFSERFYVCRIYFGRYRPAEQRDRHH